MLDVTLIGGEAWVQIFHSAGMSAHTLLLTRNEALELQERLKRALEVAPVTEPMIPDD